MNMEKVLKLVGTRIKDLRKKNGETQSTLANAIGVSQDTISKIETGKVALTLEHQLSIAEHYHVSHDYICKGIDGNTNLDLLTSYIDFCYQGTKYGDESLTYPVLLINHSLYNYLVHNAHIKSNAYIPEKIRKQWESLEAEKFYTNQKENVLQEKISVVPVDVDLICPDEKKDDWKQSDLLREIDKCIQDNAVIVPNEQTQ